MRILTILLSLLFTFTVSAEEIPGANLWQGLQEFQQQLPSLEVNSSERISEEEELELKVFISSSMPLESIKQYFQDSGKYQAILVLKGLPGNSFVSLQKFVQKLTKEGVGNLVLDEEAFERFEIKEVPTIVLSHKGKVDRISGNVSLAYALAQFKAKGENQDGAAKILERVGK